MEPKTESKVKYDDRKKELIQEFTLEQEIKSDDQVVGNATMVRKTVFTEEGIRKIYADLRDQQAKHEQILKKLKNDLKEAPEMTDELKKLEENLKIINDYNKSKQVTSQIEVQEKELKDIKKDIRDIQEAIGSRLKL